VKLKRFGLAAVLALEPGGGSRGDAGHGVVKAVDARAAP
jgi:hypothetical protein